MRDNRARKHWIVGSGASLAAFALVSAPWWMPKSCALIDKNSAGDVYSFVNIRGLEPRKARDFTRQVANEYLDGFGNDGDDPGERYVNASDCYEALAGSPHGRPEDRAQAVAYAEQAISATKTRDGLKDALVHVAYIYVVHGRQKDAEKVVARARNLASSKAEGDEFVNAVVQEIREAKSP